MFENRYYTVDAFFLVVAADVAFDGMAAESYRQISATNSMEALRTSELSITGLVLSL